MQTKTRAEQLREERATLLEKAKTIVNRVKDARRNFTKSEEDEVDGLLARVDKIDAELKGMADADAVMARLCAADSTTEPTTAKSAGYGWAKSVADRLRDTANGLGVKAVFGSSVDTPPAVDVVALPDTPTRLLDLVPRAELGANTFSYLRQTVRTNNAAVVADGDTKPTSVYTFTEIEDRARVIAHLSEPFPVRYLDDHTSVIEVLQSQMAAGVFEKIEDLIVNGSGDGEEWEGILEVAGTTPVGFQGDIVKTLRKARTALETKGERVTAVAMNPADVEYLDLLREDQDNTGGFLLDGAAYERIFGPGVQGIPTVAVPQGVAIVGDWSTTRLLVRQGVHTLAANQGSDGDAGDLFAQNLVRFRTEGRYGFQLTRPQALAVVELETSGSGSGSGSGA